MPPESYAAFATRAAEVGLGLRGAFHPQPAEFSDLLPESRGLRTVFLLGFTGSVQWPAFAASPEFSDEHPDPLDRWSRRIIGALANEWRGLAFYPNDVPPWPFQEFATRCEPVHPSPIRLLIHEQWGLWHAYRGAVAVPYAVAVPGVARALSPCVSCPMRPCLSTCPVDAITDAGYDVGACRRHVESAAGSDCRDHGCRARRACPVAPEHQYRGPQARFHMAAFIAASRRRE